MRLSFKYRLCPTVNQDRELSGQLETLRRVYNRALRERKDAWELYGVGTKFSDQVKQWQIIRGLDVAADSGPKWLSHVAAVPVRDTLKQLDLAFQNFFRRCKAGEQPGYPKFQGRDRFNSIPYDNYNSGCALVPRIKGKSVLGDMPDEVDRNGYRLKVFGVGLVKVRLHRPIKGKIKTVRIKREADKWYVIFSCDLGEVEIPTKEGPAVGIDVGLEYFLTTSEGEHVENPRLLKAELPELRRESRSMSRKRKVGSNRRKARKRVAKLHTRVKNLRREHHYQTANRLVKRYGTICVESLNIRGMLKNGKLARHISDAGWGQFLNVLTHLARKAGVTVNEVIAKGTSQECSGCGEKVPKELSVRWHSCPHCGLRLQRDHNAGLNILYRGCPELKPPARTGPTGVNQDNSLGCPRSFSLVRHPCPPVASGDHSTVSGRHDEVTPLA